MVKAVYFMHQQAWEDVYSGSISREVAQRVDLPEVRLTRDNWRQHLDLLCEAEIIVSSWGGPIVDEEFLSLAPNFKLYLYGAGTIRGLMSAAAWERGVRITSACAANAVPVAEFTLSQILFCLKHGWKMSRRCMAGESGLWSVNKKVPGVYGSTIGIVSLGMIGRKVCEMLRPFDVNVVAYDPMAQTELFDELGVEQVSLETLFATSDVVSLHAPLLKETEGMIGGKLIASMKSDASFINTARGALVKEDELIDVMRARPDLMSVLDVTSPEPPENDSPLLTLPNVVLTPHLAGSMNGECRRMGRYMVEELDRYLDGKPLKWEIQEQSAGLVA